MVADCLEIPIGCAGDVFDKWNASAKLCNYLIDILPRMYAVPGQHDLPYHSYELIEDSGFANLLKAGKIDMTEKGSFVGRFDHNFELHGFGWEQPLMTPKKHNPHTAQGDSKVVKIAIVHHYIWKEAKEGFLPATRFPGASYNDRCCALAKQLKGFDIAVFGDNHIPFEWEDEDGEDVPKVFNCGSFMRRKSDDTHRPSVGVIFSDKTVHRYYLTSADKDIVTAKKDRPGAKIDPEEVLGNPELIEAIMEMSDKDTPITFPEAVRHALRNGKIGKHIRQIILKALEG